MPEDDSRKCPRCGNRIAAAAPESLCPTCLLEMHLHTATVLTGDEPNAARAELPPVEEIAAFFPQFEILECLGRGGMGVVYKARQRSLDRLVALKILAPEREKSGEFAARFAAEAHVLARLNHPHIVTVYDFGKAQCERGTLFYLLMEFVDGINLRQLLRGRRLEPKEALAIIPTICDAVQYAHERGVVHRDIKPENLLLDKTGRVKIADFGIAKLLGAESSEREKGIGTPEYMAPEQRASAEEADHRTDIYSLGVVLYELLTGELPSEKLEPPSTRAGGMEIDVRLDEIVLRALEVKPELRYRTAAELKTELESVAHGQSRPLSSSSPRSKRPGTEGSRLTRLLRRTLFVTSPLWLTAAAIVVAGLIAPARYFAKVTMEIPPPKGKINSRAWVAEEAFENFRRAEVEKIRSPEILDKVIDQLDFRKALSDGKTRSYPQARRKLVRSLHLRPIRNTDLIEVGVLAGDPQLAANIANTVAVVYVNERMSELQRLFERALGPLNQQVVAQRAAFARAKANVEMIRLRDRVFDAEPEKFGSAPAIGGAEIHELENVVNDQTAVVARLQKQFAEATSSAVQEERAAKIAVEQAVLDDLTQKLQRARGRLQTNAKEQLGPYLEAKSRYLMNRKVLEAAEKKLSTDEFDRAIDFDPAKIWEKAEAPLSPIRSGFRRLWYALRW